MIVVLVDPLYGGNVGLVARVAANFCIQELRIVNGCDPGDEARIRAKHGRPILDRAKRYGDLQSAIDDLDITIATTGILAKKEKDWTRNSLSPKEVKERIGAYSGKIGLLFGRENYGLYNAELELADMVMHIPTCDEYPVLNLSHAVAIALFSLSDISAKGAKIPASRMEKELLREEISRALTDTEYPPHRRRKTCLMIYRIMGRAGISEEECRVLMGVLKRMG